MAQGLIISHKRADRFWRRLTSDLSWILVGCRGEESPSWPELKCLQQRCLFRARNHKQRGGKQEGHSVPPPRHAAAGTKARYGATENSPFPSNTENYPPF